MSEPVARPEVESQAAPDPNELLRAGRLQELVDVIGLPRFLSLIESGEITASAGSTALDRLVQRSTHGLSGRLASLFQRI
jgi:hypothetical protein